MLTTKVEAKLTGSEIRSMRSVARRRQTGALPVVETVTEEMKKGVLAS